MLAELQHVLRRLRRAPGSAAAVVVTLTLTLGAGTAIVAVADAVLFTPPPFVDAGALVIAGEAPVDDPSAAPRALRYATFEGWRARARALAAVEAYDGTNLTLTELGAAERLSVTDVTPGFLALLGVAPALGRGFTAEDLGQPVVLVSHAFWRTKLGAEADVVGRHLMLGGRRHTVIGVLPERFVFALNQAALFRVLPLPADPDARAAYRVRVGSLTTTAILLVTALIDVTPAAGQAAHTDPRVALHE